MQFFNVGLGEIVFILIIAGVALGPQRMVSFARQAGKIAHQVTSSPLWRDVMTTSMELRKLPQKLIQESGLDEDIKNLRQDARNLNSGTLNTILGEDNQVRERKSLAGYSGDSSSEPNQNMINPSENVCVDDDKTAGP
jgi:sec-independent protein translocase protein TatB